MLLQYLCAILKKGIRCSSTVAAIETRDFIFVQDVVRANIAAIHQGHQETINISTGLRTSINNLAHMLGMIHTPNIDVNHGPERSGDIINSCLDNMKAERILGWRPRGSLLEGLTLTYQYNFNV